MVVVGDMVVVEATKGEAQEDTAVEDTVAVAVDKVEDTAVGKEDTAVATVDMPKEDTTVCELTYNISED